MLATRETHGESSSHYLCGGAVGALGDRSLLARIFPLVADQNGQTTLRQVCKLWRSVVDAGTSSTLLVCRRTDFSALRTRLRTLPQQGWPSQASFVSSNLRTEDLAALSADARLSRLAALHIGLSFSMGSDRPVGSVTASAAPSGGGEGGAVASAAFAVPRIPHALRSAAAFTRLQVLSLNDISSLPWLFTGHGSKLTPAVVMPLVRWVSLTNSQLILPPAPAFVTDSRVTASTLPRAAAIAASESAFVLAPAEAAAALHAVLSSFPSAEAAFLGGTTVTLRDNPIFDLVSGYSGALDELTPFYDPCASLQLLEMTFWRSATRDVLLARLGSAAATAGATKAIGLDGSSRAGIALKVPRGCFESAVAAGSASTEQQEPPQCRSPIRRRVIDLTDVDDTEDLVHAMRQHAGYVPVAVACCAAAPGGRACCSGALDAAESRPEPPGHRTLTALATSCQLPPWLARRYRRPPKSTPLHVAVTMAHEPLPLRGEVGEDVSAAAAAAAAVARCQGGTAAAAVAVDGVLGPAASTAVVARASDVGTAQADEPAPAAIAKGSADAVDSSVGSSRGSVPGSASSAVPASASASGANELLSAGGKPLEAASASATETVTSSLESAVAAAVRKAHARIATAASASAEAASLLAKSQALARAYSGGAGNSEAGAAAVVAGAGALLSSPVTSSLRATAAPLAAPVLVEVASASGGSAAAAPESVASGGAGSPPQAATGLGCLTSAAKIAAPSDSATAVIASTVPERVRLLLALVDLAHCACSDDIVRSLLDRRDVGGSTAAFRAAEIGDMQALSPLLGLHPLQAQRYGSASTVSPPAADMLHSCAAVPSEGALAKASRRPQSFGLVGGGPADILHRDGSESADGRVSTSLFLRNQRSETPLYIAALRGYAPLLRLALPRLPAAVEVQATADAADSPRRKSASTLTAGPTTATPVAGSATEPAQADVSAGAAVGGAGAAVGMTAAVAEVTASESSASAAGSSVTMTSAVASCSDVATMCTALRHPLALGPDAWTALHAAVTSCRQPAVDVVLAAACGLLPQLRDRFPGAVMTSWDHDDVGVPYAVARAKRLDCPLHGALDSDSDVAAASLRGHDAAGAGGGSDHHDGDADGVVPRDAGSAAAGAESPESDSPTALDGGLASLTGDTLARWAETEAAARAAIKIGKSPGEAVVYVCSRCRAGLYDAILAAAAASAEATIEARAAVRAAERAKRRAEADAAVAAAAAAAAASPADVAVPAAGDGSSTAVGADSTPAPTSAPAADASLGSGATVAVAASSRPTITTTLAGPGTSSSHGAFAVTSAVKVEDPLLAFLEAADRWGCTALHYAARNGSAVTVALLLRCGANAHAKASGATPSAMLTTLLRGGRMRVLPQHDMILHLLGHGQGGGKGAGHKGAGKASKKDAAAADKDKGKDKDKLRPAPQTAGEDGASGARRASWRSKLKGTSGGDVDGDAL